MPTHRFPLHHIRMADTWIATASRRELVDAAVHDAALQDTPARLIFDANGHGIALARTNPEFAKALDNADVVHADGGFLVSMSKRIAGDMIKERSPTTDLIHDFAQSPKASHLTHFLLGATEQVNARAATILQATYPNFQIAGRRNGYFTRDQEDDVVDAINASGADVLWVGLGKPLEQAFCLRNRDRLKAAWVITAGGCYNYITGDYPRAPNWMQANNLEWLHRMVTRPRQLGWRYLTSNPVALHAVLRNPDRRTMVRR